MLWTAAGLLGLGAGIAGTAFGQTAPRPLAPLIGVNAASAIPNQYVVVFAPGTSESTVQAAQALAVSQGGKIGFTYGAALIGFSVTASSQAIDRLRAAAGVSAIEADSVYTASIIQSGAPDGLDRIDRRLIQSPLNHQFTYSHHGTGVHAYVIDTGVRASHVELFPRASGAGFTAITDAFGTGDCVGHGTHVAGTIGGTTFGVAKNVNLHSVRVLDCSGTGTLGGILAGINWVTSNAVFPAVANMSLGGGFSPTMNAAVTTAVGTGITFVAAAGNSEIDACTVSPASTPAAITVGNVNPLNDTRFVPSNFGTCLDLFAPGKDILSAIHTSNTATGLKTGTSMAAPHVAGVAALYLQTHTAASPATVWAAILNAADVSTTPGWPGVINPNGSPNVLLHWGSLNDGYNDGDPHLTTVGGVHYDFQGAGEFVMLRDGNGTEIQTRQSPVETNGSTVTNAYTGLTSCVSLNTAVAARVGTHRISYVPNVNGVPDPSGLQLRVDGVLTTLGSGGLSLGAGGHIANYATGGINVTFPDGTTMIATPNWWPTQSRWYLNISVFHTQADEGLIGALATGSWLPALPNGSSLGPRPVPLHDRYVDLNQTFANAWRVTNATSLFDYGPGTSTSTFTIPSWPPESGACIIPQSGAEPVKPLDDATAQQVCAVITDRDRRADCVADVQVTGEVGFANAHQISELVVAGGTRTRLDTRKTTTAPGEEARFVATVQRHASSGQDATPGGAVQFSLDGRDIGGRIKLDATGTAVWLTRELPGGVHTIGARYLAPLGSSFFDSASLPLTYTVR